MVFHEQMTATHKQDIRRQPCTGSASRYEPENTRNHLACNPGVSEQQATSNPLIRSTEHIARQSSPCLQLLNQNTQHRDDKLPQANATHATKQERRHVTINNITGNQQSKDYQALLVHATTKIKHISRRHLRSLLASR